jgi:hypothetical protein
VYGRDALHAAELRRLLWRARWEHVSRGHRRRRLRDRGVRLSELRDVQADLHDGIMRSPVLAVDVSGLLLWRHLRPGRPDSVLRHRRGIVRRLRHAGKAMQRHVL